MHAPGSAMFTRKMVVRLLLCNAFVAAWLALGFGTPAQAAEPLRIVVLGDSLVAGFNIRVVDAFPAQLERALKAKGHNVEVINAGVSGDTTAAGLDRLQWAVPENADAVIVELGANDALRGLDPATARANLDKILATLTAQKAEILVAGMKAPRNLPPSYVAAFDAIYPDLAQKYGALLYPFFIEKTALDPKLSLPDGLHPNARGVEAIVADILPKVEELIGRIKARRQVDDPALAMAPRDHGRDLASRGVFPRPRPERSRDPGAQRLALGLHRQPRQRSQQPDRDHRHRGAGRERLHRPQLPMAGSRQHEPVQRQAA